VLALALIALLAGCGKKDEEPDAPAPPDTPAPPPAAPTTPPSDAAAGQPTPKEPVPDDEFARQFREVLELEAQGKFPPAYIAARKMRSEFSRHPRIEELNAAIMRLKEAREMASELSFAVENLTSTDPGQRKIAKRKLVNAGHAGMVYLRLALRTGSDETAREAAHILIEQKDKESLPLLIAQFNKYPGSELADAMIKGFKIIHPSMTTEQLAALFERVKSDTEFKEAAIVEVFMDVLRRGCGGDEDRFNERLGSPEAYADLVDYARRGIISGKPGVIETISDTCLPLLPNINMLRAEYFSETKYETPLATRMEKHIHHPHNRQFRTPDKRQDNFSVRWSGFLDIEEEKAYTFYLNADDKAWFHIDGKDVLYCEWGREQKKEIKLSKGLHPVRMQYIQSTGNCWCKLEWAARGISRTGRIPFRTAPWKEPILAAAKAPAKLGDADWKVAKAGRTDLANAGEIGRWILRDAAKTMPIDKAIKHLETLARWKDAEAFDLILKRIPETKPNTDSRERLVVALRNMSSRFSKERCAALLAGVKKSTKVGMSLSACVLAGVLEYACLGDKTKFNECVGDPTAYDTLKDHISKALASSDSSAVIRACAYGGFLAPFMRGLRGRYYDGQDMDSKVLSRIDGLIHIDRNEFPHPKKTMTDVSARWVAWFHVSKAGEYHFWGAQRQNFNGWVDGRHILARHGNDAYGKITLQPGWHNFRVDYRQGAGDNYVYVDWQGPGIGRQRFSDGWARAPLTERELRSMPQHIANLADPAKAADSIRHIDWTGDVGTVFLKNAVRHSPEKIASAAARMLAIRHDRSAPGLIVARLKKGVSAPTGKMLLDLLREGPHHLSEEDCRWLYAQAKGKPLEENRGRLALLISILENRCHGNKALFNKLMDNPKATDSLGDVVKLGLKSKNDPEWKWAMEFGGPWAPWTRGVRNRCYEGRNFEKLVADRRDWSMKFDDRRFPHPKNVQDNVSARMRTHLWIEKPGDYQFVAQADDGVRVYVDGRRVIDAWSGQANRRDAWGAAKLAKGWHLVEADWNQATKTGYMWVHWQGPGVSRREIRGDEARAHPWAAEINVMFRHMKDLGNKDHNKVRNAQELFRRHFDSAGRICLQRALDFEKGKVLTEAAGLLHEFEDPAVLQRLVERLEKDADPEVNSGAVGMFYKMPDRLSDDQLATLMQVVAKDAKLARLSLVDFLGNLYLGVCRRNAKTFDQRTRTEGGFGQLREYVWRASRSSDKKIAKWGKDRVKKDPWKKK